MSLLAQPQIAHQQRCLRITGLVQGVGFRPVVWQLASALNLCGNVFNDAQGVVINLQGDSRNIDDFIAQLTAKPPKLARIDQIIDMPVKTSVEFKTFEIIASQQGIVSTGIIADAASCPDCIREIRDLSNRRHAYAFTNCTHCGPRFSITRRIPYDRSNTSMQAFKLCPACETEYRDPADRRFHAQPNACPQCGPQLQLLDNQHNIIDCKDPLEATAQRLINGEIVAIKGIGGVHLACDAGNQTAIERLRERKQRPHKPFALMAKDIQQIQQFCHLSTLEQQALLSTSAPVVLLAKKQPQTLPSALAPEQSTLGFMLAHSPLHHLLMDRLKRPLVMTSGNLSEELPCTDNQDSLQRLANIADSFLLHDRQIINRIDDSVCYENLNKIRLLRRARGYAPATINLPAGFQNSDGILALGGELKNTFCLIKNGQAMLSQHLGDLEDARTYADFDNNLKLYQSLFEFQPVTIAIDGHPDYLSSKYGQRLAAAQQLACNPVQHHHAHIASCMLDNDLPLQHPGVIGIAFDGLGMGHDNELWGGEFLLADYRFARRIARLQPVALPGAAQAMREPWRNTYAQLHAAGLLNAQTLSLISVLDDKPLDTLEQMLDRQINAPLCSSAGRLFDAVAAALGIAPEKCSYEGQAAMQLESLIDEDDLNNAKAYRLVIQQNQGLFEIQTGLLWQQLLNDLAGRLPVKNIAAAFLKGLIEATVDLTLMLCRQHKRDTVALSGGVFQNRLLVKHLYQSLTQQKIQVLLHENIPANDGGLAMGQAVITAAQMLQRR